MRPTKLTRLRLVRLEAGLTQLALAGMSGVSASRISLYERRLLTPSPAHRRAFALALDCPADELFVEEAAT